MARKMAVASPSSARYPCSPRAAVTAATSSGAAVASIGAPLPGGRALLGIIGLAIEGDGGDGGGGGQEDGDEGGGEVGAPSVGDQLQRPGEREGGLVRAGREE